MGIKRAPKPGQSRRITEGGSLQAHNVHAYPGVCVQAALAGVPVLGSRIGGIPEIVMDGETGRLLAPDDLDAWRAATEELVAHPEELCRRLGDEVA